MRPASRAAHPSAPLLRRLLGAVVLVAGAGAPVRGQGYEHAEHAAASPDSARLGRIQFPTSARRGAHALFERGVLYLHNFHYPEAVATFRRARALDSADVMSAAFEAFAYTHPVWNQQDTASARAALRALAPTRAARLALARTPRERAWLDAIEALYDDAVGPKPPRDSAFSRAMAAIHAAEPRDPEAATFYALSLLGLNQSDREAVAYTHAEAIADTVLAARPRHPGALHYKIHAVDDPPSARRGVAAARLYGEVAPAAAHALHMTSHIYIALGRWDDVVDANRRAAAAAPHVFGHSTHWLVYGLLQQGRVHEASAWVDSMLLYNREVQSGAVATSRGKIDAFIHSIFVPATYVVDAEAWDTPLAHMRLEAPNARNMAVRARGDFFVGYTAARRAGRPTDVAGGSRAADRALADSMLARLTARHLAQRAQGNQSSDLGEAEVMEQMLRAELLGPARADSALALLRAAAAKLEALPFAFGPPAVIKPPRERAAELLLLLNRPAEALAELDLSEKTAPLRALAQLRRARALEALGRRDEARRVYAALVKSWHAADADYPWLAEARWGRGDLPDVGRGGSRAAARDAVADTIAYPSGELSLRGVLWRPAGAGRRPAVVILHGSGGCWRASGSDWLGRLFAAHGYVTFFPCRRGQGLSQGRGEWIQDQVRREAYATPQAAGARAIELLRTTQLADVRAAIAAVRARPDVDAARVAVSGISYGGILTLLAAEDDSTLRAAVPFAPAAMNWEWNTPLREQLLTVARRTRVPTLVVQAENDWSVGPSRDLPGALRAGGAPADVRLYPPLGGEAATGHGLMALAPDVWRDDVFAFLDRHMRPAALTPRRAASR